MIRKPKKKSVGDQLKKKVKKLVVKEMYEGNDSIMVSTGSTLADLAISGTRKRGGGLPVGIAVEIFGPNSAGKTVLLCEIAGYIQRMGGDILFNDSEYRLDKEFAKLFDMEIKEGTVKTPDTVSQIFDCFDTWEKKGPGPYGLIADSISAASTKEEMEATKGYDGAKRANDFSQGFRINARRMKQENYLMVFSNQIRAKMDAGTFEKKTKATGGYAPAFYTSVRLEIKRVAKLSEDLKVYGKEHRQFQGIVSQITVEKSSVDKSSFRTAPIHIVWDYGIDDITPNLKYLKQNSKHKMYSIDGIEKLGNSITEARETVEREGLEHKLKEAVIDLWEYIEAQFEQNRKKKVR